MRRAIVIAGMHRSGTSALAGMIGLLGAAMPRHLLGADENNPKGHWESERLMELNERMLREGGSRWDDWRAFDPAVLGEQRLDEIVAELAAVIGEEFGDAPLIAIKDPRVCRLAPVHAQALRRMNVEPAYVLPFRNPLAVIASLGRRNDMTPGYAEFMWLRHVLDAEAATRASRRSVVSYEALLVDWRAAAAGIARDLDLDWPRSIEDAGADIDLLLSPDLRRFTADASELAAERDITGWTRSVHAALLRLAGGDSDATVEFDRVRAEFDPMSAAFGRAALPELDARERRLAGLADIRQSLLDMAQRDPAHRAEADSPVAATRAMDVPRDGRDEALDRVSALEAQAGALDAEKSRLELELAAIRSSRLWRWTAPIRSATERVRAMFGSLRRG